MTKPRVRRVGMLAPMTHELEPITRPDGTSDPDALARYLEENPDKVAVLERLGHDMVLATEAAAAAAIRACATI